MKKLFPILLLVLAILACSRTTNVPATATPVPPTATPLPGPTGTPTLIPTATPNADAADFGDPILAALLDVAPTAQDDFSIDRGWFGTTGGGNDSAAMVSVEDGFLRVAGDGPGRGFTHMLNNDYLRLDNFVVIVDAAFLGEEGRAGERFIGLCWWPGDNHGERFLLDETGWFEGATCTPGGPCPDYVTGHVDPLRTGETVSLILIHRGNESAVYVNAMPYVYHNLPVTNVEYGFSLCPHTADLEPSAIAYDNLRVWNLDAVSLP